MDAERRYVFDTNTIISALLFEESVPARAFRIALGCGSILLSSATFAELREVLGSSKFDRYVTREDRGQFLVRFVHRARLIEPLEPIQVCRDPKDDKFLELTAAGGAVCLITGDRDLLIHHPFRGAAILTPAQFVASMPQVDPAS